MLDIYNVIFVKTSFSCVSDYGNVILGVAFPTPRKIVTHYTI